MPQGVDCMLIITIVSLIAFSIAGSMCIDLHEENKRLRKWKQSRIELDQRLSKEAFESIRNSCEDIQKSLEEQSKRFDKKLVVQMDGKKIAEAVTKEIRSLREEV
jgi:O6-methylguanine-DNA--protein-cysteine methyltransferase